MYFILLKSYLFSDHATHLCEEIEGNDDQALERMQTIARICFCRGARSEVGYTFQGCEIAMWFGEIRVSNCRRSSNQVEGFRCTHLFLAPFVR